MPAIAVRRTGHPSWSRRGRPRIRPPAATPPRRPVPPASDVSTAEIHPAVPLIGCSPGEQALGERDHLPDVGMRPGLHRRRPDSERGHVAVEVELLDRGEPVVGGAGLAGGRQQHVIHVGHIAAEDHLGAACVQHPGQRIHPHERGGMAQMSDVIGRDAARVHSRPAHQRERCPAERGNARPASGLYLIHRRPGHQRPPSCQRPVAAFPPTARLRRPGPAAPGRWSPESWTNDPGSSGRVGSRLAA